MATMNMRQWRKAYMLEFLENGKVEEVFTFSVPPESETLEFPQRVTETPTFGGVVIDDYGNDTVKIRLTGTTVNEERKFIYRGNNSPPLYLTGEKEIFELQKIFQEWGGFGKIPSKKVYLYDLSKMNALQILAGSPARNYWRIVNKNLKIRRSKEKPFTYIYELDFIGLLDDEHSPEPLFGNGKLGGFLDACQKVVGFIEMCAEIGEMAADAIDTLGRQAVEVRKFIEKIQGGDDWQKAEMITRKLPGGNSLWNCVKAYHSTVSSLSYILGESSSQLSAGVSKADEYTVSYNSGAGSYVAPGKVPYGDYGKEPDMPSLPKFEFKGWYTNNEYDQLFDFETEEITKNITLYAKWERTEADITYNSRQGSAVFPQTVKIGEAATAPEPPTRAGYAFEYWCRDVVATVKFDFLTPITDDIILYARWRAVHTVSFNANGGTGTPSQLVNTSEKVIYPVTPVRENYLFSMWCSDPALNAEYNFNSEVNSNMTLHAKWTRVTNNVIFNSNGGTEILMQVVNLGACANKPPDPAKEGHTFLRWCSDETLSQEFLFESNPVNYPVTLYARWMVKVYNIVFSGATEIPDQQIPYQGLAVYPPVPVKPGEIFYRWCIDSELTTEFDFSTPIIENMTLYPAWHGGG